MNTTVIPCHLRMSPLVIWVAYVPVSDAGYYDFDGAVNLPIHNGERLDYIPLAIGITFSCRDRLECETETTSLASSPPSALMRWKVPCIKPPSRGCLLSRSQRSEPSSRRASQIASYLFRVDWLCGFRLLPRL